MYMLGTKKRNYKEIYLHFTDKIFNFIKIVYIKNHNCERNTSIFRGNLRLKFRIPKKCTMLKAVQILFLPSCF